MKLIDRYICKEFIGPFLSGLAAFAVILSGSTILFKMIDYAVKFNIGIKDLIIVISLQIPYIIALSIPMATLFATISCFGRLSNDLEILAFKAHGVSVVRMLVPIVFMGILVSALNIVFNEFIVPKSASASEELLFSYKNNKTPKIQSNLNITEYKDKLPFRVINVAEKEGNLLRNITIAEYKNGFLNRLIRAESGTWILHGAWEFYDGVMHNFQENDLKRVTVIEFEKEFINMDLRPVDFDNRHKKVEEMSGGEMLEKIEFEKRKGSDPIKLIMDYHMKIALAFSSLIYCILGASMGLRPHRSSSAMGIGLSLLVIFSYIILLSIGMGLGLSKTLPPLIAAWLPNIIIGMLSLLLARKVVSQ
jgi:lipopolysaccharide export system permease protein